MRYPFENEYKITSPFGNRQNPFATGGIEFHDGVDFATPAGTPILAATDGLVTLAKFSTLWGNYVEITEGAEIMTRYAHLNSFNVTIGQRVTAGAVIGYAGSTGRSTGAHLHFGVAKYGTFVNPMPFLEINDDEDMFKKNLINAIKNSNLDAETKRLNENAVFQNDPNYLVAFLGTEARNQLVVKDAALTLLKGQLDAERNKPLQIKDCTLEIQKVIQETETKYTQKITDLSQMLENERLKTVKNPTDEKFDFSKFMAGASKNAYIQSILGVVITSAIGFITSQIPELESQKELIVSSLLGLLGIGVASQNISNIVKINK